VSVDLGTALPRARALKAAARGAAGLAVVVMMVVGRLALPAIFIDVATASHMRVATSSACHGAGFGTLAGLA
jgi:hypothetical protein